MGVKHGRCADALNQIQKAPQNQSPWAYLKGLVEPIGYSVFPQLRETCERLAIHESTKGHRYIPALALLVDILESSGVAANVVRSAQLCDELCALDPIQDRYWRWRESRMLAGTSGSAAALAAAAQAAPDVSASRLAGLWIDSTTPLLRRD